MRASADEAQGHAAFVAGTGSFSAEVSDWARAAGFQVVGLVELQDPSRVGTRVHGLPVRAIEDRPAGASIVLGAGGDRRLLWERLCRYGWIPVGLTHPSAAVASDARLGEGVTVGPLAAIGAASEIGEHALLSRGVLIGHHVRVGAFSTINPGANIGGNTTIGRDGFIGMSAVVADGLSVGEGALVAAGALVMRNVEPQTRVQGLPARPVGLARPNPLSGPDVEPLAES